MNAQKEKTSGVHASPQKCAVKMKETKKQEKRHACKNVIYGRKLFIMPIPKTGENDPHELQGNNCGYNEDTICLVNKSIAVKGMVFDRGCTNRHH